ncbi:MAG: hypothetical protein WCK02_05460 [Bacteroidota bacterium]
MKYILTLFVIICLSIYSFAKTESNLDSISKDCNFDKYLKDPKTPKLAKDIFNNQNWDLNDFIILSFLDSLTAKDIEARPFYFKVVTNSFNKSDGYYSEGLGNAGKEYVENNTVEFAKYFNSKKCFNNTDLDTWVKIVLLEFYIFDDNECTQKVINQYIEKLNLNCINASDSEKLTIKNFSNLLEIGWKDYLEKNKVINKK